MSIVCKYEPWSDFLSMLCFTRSSVNSFLFKIVCAVAMDIRVPQYNLSMDTTNVEVLNVLLP